MADAKAPLFPKWTLTRQAGRNLKELNALLQGAQNTHTLSGSEAGQNYRQAVQIRAAELRDRLQAQLDGSGTQEDLDTLLRELRADLFYTNLAMQLFTLINTSFYYSGGGSLLLDDRHLAEEAEKQS